MTTARRLPRLSLLAGFLAVVGCCLGKSMFAAEPTTPTTSTPSSFEWNVFLDNWRVIGPFPKLARDQRSSELDRELLDDEAELRPGEPIVVDGKEHKWREWPGRMIDFIRALDVELSEAQYVLGYAYTEFTSDSDQDAILGIGHDDCVRLWLNGEEIHRNDSWVSSELDQATIPVKLKQGVNRLLAKVTQGSGNWEFAARLRPAGFDEPLISFRANGSSNGDLSRLPLLEIDLLDNAGEVMTTLRASGGRSDGSGVRYTAYGPEPDPAPAEARVHFEARGFEPYDKKFSWEQVRTGSRWISLSAKDRVRGRVIDEKTGRPVEGAEILAGESPVAKPTDADGRFEFTMKTPFADIVEVRAGGFEPRQVRVAHDGEWIIKVAPGGHIFRGRVLSTRGEPIVGAAIEAYASRRNIRLTTDDDGRFEISGLPGDVDYLHPTVSHPQYVAKDRFQQLLEADGVTEVEWQLEDGCVIEGRVTAKSDGRPIGGIEIVAGSDRFASNSVNPQAFTDAEGRYRLGGLRSGSVMVHAFSREYVPAVATATASLEQPGTADFSLAPGEAISGRVVDPDGKPVAGLTLAIDTINGARMLNRRVNTDENGEFRYDNMPDTPVKIDMFKRDWVSKRDYTSHGGEHTEITLYPVVEHTARVRLTDTGESPQQLDAQIGYQWQGRDEISWQEENYSDNFVYDASAGEFRIHVDEPSSGRLFFRLRVPGYRDAVIENPELGTPAKSWDVELEKVDTTRGTVVDADSGRPLAGVLVALVNKEDRLRLDHYVNYSDSLRALEKFTGIKATTTDDGGFELSQPTSEQATDLVLFRAGQSFCYIPNAREVLAGGGARLPLPAGGTLEGQVVIAGQPVADAPVHIAWVAAGEGNNPWDLPFGFGGQARTDADGRFRYAGLGPGKYQVNRIRNFRWPSGRGSMSSYLIGSEVLVLPGQTVTHDFITPPGHKVSGEVVDPEGKPAADCQVEIMQAGQSGRVDVVFTKADGRFEFQHLQPGNYTLRVERYVPSDWGGLNPGGGNGTGTVKIADGDATTTIKVTPRATGPAPRPGATGQVASLVGSVPPDFTGKLLGSDESFTLSDHFGKVVAIDFWATWCGPCMAVMPETKEFYEKYKDSNDVLFVTVSLDQDAETLKNVMVEQGIEFPVIYENRAASQAIASSFGATAIPSSFVIGRDGRFASERVHGSQLVAAAEAAIESPVENPFGKGMKPARLMISLSLDGVSGVPGAEIRLKAFDEIGMPVGEESIRTPGQSQQVTWLYRPLEEGGRIEVAVAAAGLPDQEKTVTSPSQAADVEFAFESPRTIRGAVKVDDPNAKSAPVAGMKVLAYRADGLRRDTTTDVEGKFEIRVMPGSYFIQPVGNDEFAPVIRQREQLEVADDKDPEVLSYTACRTVTVTGTVTDESDEPVEDAQVRTTVNETVVKTDAEGRFSLPGVPSRGQVQLYALKQPKFAQLMLEDCDGQEPLTLVLGDRASGGGGKLTKGMKSPPLKLTTLDRGKSIEWKPGERDTLVLFAPLWHPATKDLVAGAQQWAEEHDAELAVCSTDWSLEQARREAAAYPAAIRSADVIHYAGPGGLEIVKDWGWAGSPRAYLVGTNGKISAAPPAGTLP